MVVSVCPGVVVISVIVVVGVAAIVAVAIALAEVEEPEGLEELQKLEGLQGLGTSIFFDLRSIITSMRSDAFVLFIELKLLEVLDV